MADLCGKFVGPFILLTLSPVFKFALGDSNEYYYDAENGYWRERVTKGNCIDGQHIPLWDIQKYGNRVPDADRAIRAILYISALLYLFLGVAIFLNKMMEAMETFMSLMKKSSVSDPETGETNEIIAKRWNQGISNMLMVLCSVSPHICLCINAVSARLLSPHLATVTVMGSSAFTLLIGVGTIVSAVPENQVRKLDNYYCVFYLIMWSVVIYPVVFTTYGEGYGMGYDYIIVLVLTAAAIICLLLLSSE